MAIGLCPVGREAATSLDEGQSADRAARAVHEGGLCVSLHALPLLDPCRQPREIFSGVLIGSLRPELRSE